MEYLNEQEKKSLEKFVSDSIMVGAVKKVLLADLYSNGTLNKDSVDYKTNWVFGLVMNEVGQDYKQTNEELGEKVRACIEGIKALELAFKQIEKYKPIEIDISEPVNQAV